ncbi:MAG TPA: hypothetical protein VNT79_06305 [Phycisphaerae bacterium]|nr:hypothetical protein [Phycisphaerae bacterium]
MTAEHSRRLDPREIPKRLSEIRIEIVERPLRDTAIRQILPDAAEFNAAFGVGGRNDQVSTIDAAGVALAAIQGLYHLIQDAHREIVEQKVQIDELTRRVSDPARPINPGGFDAFRRTARPV